MIFKKKTTQKNRPYQLLKWKVSKRASWQPAMAHVRARIASCVQLRASTVALYPTSTRQVFRTAASLQPVHPAATCKAIPKALLLLRFFPQAVRHHLNTFTTTHMWTQAWLLVPLLNAAKQNTVVLNYLDIYFSYRPIEIRNRHCYCYLLMFIQCQMPYLHDTVIWHSTPVIVYILLINSHLQSYSIDPIFQCI